MLLSTLVIYFHIYVEIVITIYYSIFQEIIAVKSEIGWANEKINNSSTMN